MDKTHASDEEIMYTESDFLPLNHKVISCTLHSNPGSDLITLYTSLSENAQWFGYAPLSAEAFLKRWPICNLKIQSEVNHQCLKDNIK